MFKIRKIKESVTEAYYYHMKYEWDIDEDATVGSILDYMIRRKISGEIRIALDSFSFNDGVIQLKDGAITSGIPTNELLNKRITTLTSTEDWQDDTKAEFRTTVADKEYLYKGSEIPTIHVDKNKEIMDQYKRLVNFEKSTHKTALT